MNIDTKEVDICISVRIIEKFSPDIILCPAGKVNVDWIEQNPQEAWEINVAKLNVLFELASKKDIPIAFFSTDYIFDGREGPYSENAIPNPLNFYGKHKLVSEIMLKTFLPNKHYIFRTTWVFGQEMQGKNFVYSIVKSLSMGKEINIPEDLIATPTYVVDVAKNAVDLIEKNTFGTYNITSNNCITRLEFAKSIANIFQLNTSLITPAKSSSMKSPANRPQKAGLKNDKINATISASWTPLEIALKETKIQMEKAGQFPYDSTSVNKPSVVEKKSTKICIFIPCYNAITTLPKVLERIPNDIKEKVEEIFIIDNDSTDYTYLIAIGYREKKSDIKNLKVLKNIKNFGYGGSQKLAYAYAIKYGYDLVVMLHGDAQYAPEKLPIMIETMEKDKSIDLLFGSRMTGDPLKGGMPLHRFWGNKILTFIQNFLLGTNISEFHSGYRIFRTSALTQVPFHLCDSYYHFDTEIILLFINKHLKIAEVPIDTFYGNEKCYVNIWKYSINVFIATFCYWLYKKKIKKYELYKKDLKADINKIFQEFKTEIY